jgi:hypothetical protein
MQQMKNTKESYISYRENGSIMCRLLDGQREGQLTQKLDIDTLNTKYLPEKLADLKNFIYNQQVLFFFGLCCKNSFLGQA